MNSAHNIVARYAPAEDERRSLTFPAASKFNKNDKRNEDYKI